ncbi:Serine/threonine-protein kinase Ppk16 [Trichophyton interdigitale]|uniref:non-specific serine/threonine protein kinase n=1 Tax=Trichophyton interdigitale TaxID=101480 RepID=A0A9P4YHN2_9EURO|nr:Serine/threonine-protein kinase Ppk16 [Trichophyton interdigitale]KAF3894763.1 Serine/threonine-protein kinase Ppk16 [Trichophyton interdigitale]KAG8209616.1 Serine/threonine-protein kinase Ppk16 [Trichophyton interdigitale]
MAARSFLTMRRPLQLSAFSPLPLSRGAISFSRTAPKSNPLLRNLPRHSSTLEDLTVVTINPGPPGQYEFMDDSIESLDRYIPGGYHPIAIGDLLNNRYRIVHKLGYGGYSTTWISRDEQKATYAAVKVKTADSTPREADVLRTIASSSSHLDHPGRPMIPRIHDQFELQGPNGRHICYVMDLAQCSVADATFWELFSIETARSLAAQLVLAVAYLHKLGIVHGNIHPNNVLIRLLTNLDQLSVKELYEKFEAPLTEPVVRRDAGPLPAGVPSHGTFPIWLGKGANEMPPSEARLILSDFGESFRPSDPSQQVLGEECLSHLAYLPPEAHFELKKPISYPSDIWELACTVWSILASQDLFYSMLATSDYICKQQIDILGPLPPEWWTAWEARPRYYDESGQPTPGSAYPTLSQLFVQDIQMRRLEGGKRGFDTEEALAFVDMIRSMLAFRPEQRATIETVLASDWMTKWGLPEFQKLPPAK